ncbi:MAG TPA: aminotransferase class I/II-fold pyridoxal phosphate-dependent enzyme [Chryseolinea sp.]|nr:aminotransferase class I/II-fold pyridoxal phosphate-dependent enzyme [Chryseolinea sp.]
MKAIDTILEERLEQRSVKGLLRSLTLGDPARIDFASNDYLGLARSKTLFDDIRDDVDRLGDKTNGSSGSRLLTGNSPLIEEVEAMLSTIFISEATLIFNSGYTANLSVLSSLPQRGDTIIYDEYAHACMKDGARLSMAKRLSFRHNDLDDLEAKLKVAQGHIFIAVESIYSMDGDECPLREIVALARAFGAKIILDEAHSTGTMGAGGAGLAVSLGLEKQIAVRIYTFGKAMGIHGACVAGSTQLKRYLINFARPFIYTTAPDPHSIIAIRCSFKYLRNHLYLQDQLKEIIGAFVENTQGCSGRTRSTSAIQGFICPGNENVKEAARKLQDQGFDVRAILSPTVPAGAERLRICLHTYNSMQEVSAIAQQLTLLSSGHGDQ